MKGVALPFELEINFADLSLSGVYMLTMNTGYFYIGSTRNFKTRLVVHRTSFRNGYKENIRISNKMKECACIRFDVLEIVSDFSILKTRENHYLSIYNGNIFLLNIAPTAFSVKGVVRTKEEKEHVSRSHRSIKKEKNIGRPVYFKKVVNTETGEVFNSVRDLSAKTGRSAQQYVKRLNGGRKNNTPYKYMEGEWHLVYK